MKQHFGGRDRASDKAKKKLLKRQQVEGRNFDNNGTVYRDAVYAGEEEPPKGWAGFGLSRMTLSPIDKIGQQGSTLPRQDSLYHECDASLEEQQKKRTQASKVSYGAL